MIQLSNVTRKYTLDENTVIEPVSDVSLEIKEKEFTVVIGRSGNGKTTLLNLMAGLIRPSSGKVVIDGAELQTMNDREISALRSRKIGFVFQFPSLLPSLNVVDNVMLPRNFITPGRRKENRERAAKLLESVGLGQRMNSFPKQLSAGEQKRAVIVRAIINEPGILLADEPTSDLDERTEAEIMNLLMRIHASGVIVVMVTHNLQLIPYATRAFRMESGKLTELAVNRKSF